jgi:hypothetical protein
VKRKKALSWRGVLWDVPCRMANGDRRQAKQWLFIILGFSSRRRQKQELKSFISTAVRRWNLARQYLVTLKQTACLWYLMKELRRTYNTHHSKHTKNVRHFEMIKEGVFECKMCSQYRWQYHTFLHHIELCCGMVDLITARSLLMTCIFINLLKLHFSKTGLPIIKQ